MPRDTQQAMSRASLERYTAELPHRLDAVFRAHPELDDHRSQFPWVLACLGDPFAPVWFIAENPSLTQMERALDSTPEDQWNVSIGDKLFRQQLVQHGFKQGTAESAGGWRCYITDVIKSADRVGTWNKLPETQRAEIAEAWAPVLAWELELGQPKVVVSVGNKADRLLNHLLRRRLIPPLPLRLKVEHYSYIGSRPDAKTGLGPRHPDRIAAWSTQFAGVRAALDGKPAGAVPRPPPPSIRPAARKTMARQRDALSKRDVIKLAAMRREGVTWAQVDEAAGFHQSSTGWRETFEAHGFDKLGVKHGVQCHIQGEGVGHGGRPRSAYAGHGVRPGPEAKRALAGRPLIRNPRRHPLVRASSAKR